MPEGDSLLQLSERLQFMTGRRVTHTSVRVPRFATFRFDGMDCIDVWPYGKHLFMQFNDYILHTHLKMEGLWAVHLEGDRWRHPGHSARIVLGLANEPRNIELVGHWLGLVDIYPAAQYRGKVAHLGPDILDPDWETGPPDRPGWGRREALARILERPERSVGAALLDQRNVAGIGNEYRVEACFIAGIHPATPVGVLGPDGVAKLLDVTRRIMWANRFSPLRVTTGVRRAGESSYVFGRNNERCRRCNAPIAKSVLGGVDAGGDEGELERIIWWCPNCQPLEQHPPGWDPRLRP